MPVVIPPNIGPDDSFFWDGVNEDRLCVKSCASCGYLQHPPTPMCPKCGSVEWTVKELSGRGSVYSWIVSKHPNRSDDEGRIVAVIDLEEGLRLVSNLTGLKADAVRPGLPVKVGFEDLDGVWLPQFRPAGEVVA